MIRKRWHKQEFEIPAILGDVKPVIRLGGRDKTTQKRFVPNINMSFGFGGPEEFFLNVNDQSVTSGDDSPSLVDGVLGSTVGDRTTRFYINEDGTLEHEMVLASKPASNRIDLKIKCSPALKFCHQPALTQSEIDEGCRRPDDIVNSYAVYCDKKHNKYKTGKLCHIKRSFVIDKYGRKTWCEQTIDVHQEAGTWSIIIPKKIWANAALYPLTVGPNLGYETVGGSSSYASANYAYYLHVGEMTEGGTLDSVTIYDTDYSPSPSTRFGVYDNDGGDGSEPVNRIFDSGDFAQSTGQDWFTETANDETLTSGDEIYAAIICSAASDCEICYDSDTGTPNHHEYMGSVTLPDPAAIDSSGMSDRQYSAYITYTASGGGTTVPSLAMRTYRNRRL